MPTARQSKTTEELPDSSRDAWFRRPPLSDRSRVRKPKIRELSREVLLAGLAPNARRFQTLLSRPKANRIDWDWIVDRAIAHKVCGLLAARISSFEADTRLTAETLARLETWRELTATRAQQCARTLAEVARAFDRVNLPFVVVKGRILNQWAYPRSKTRASSDVDLLIKFEDCERAEVALSGIGYDFNDPWIVRRGYSEAKAKAARLKEHRHFTFAPPENRVAVELHWTLSFPHVANVTAEQLWSEVERHEIVGREMRTLSAEANLLHLCWHATEKGPLGVRLIHLCDIAWYLKAMRQRIDVERLHELAREWNLERMLDNSLWIIEDLFRFSTAAWRTESSREVCPQRIKAVATPDAIIEQRVGRTSAGALRAQTSRRIQLAQWDLAFGRLPVAATRDLLGGYWRALKRDAARSFGFGGNKAGQAK